MTAGGDGSAHPVGRVAEIWRYPVKSMGGERLDRADCDRRGVEGDRWWAVVGADGKLGSGKTTRRFRRMPGLLHMTAATGDGVPAVLFPDGRRGPVDDPATAGWVAEVVGEAVDLRPEGAVPHFDDSPLHLVTTAEMAGLHQEMAGLHEDLNGAARIERRRFRPNLVVDAPDSLRPGARYAVGDQLVIAVGIPTERCVMTTMTQPGLDFAPGILKHLERRHGGCFGLYASIENPGPVTVGDAVVPLA